MPPVSDQTEEEALAQEEEPEMSTDTKPGNNATASVDQAEICAPASRRPRLTPEEAAGRRRILANPQPPNDKLSRSFADYVKSRQAGASW